MPIGGKGPKVIVGKNSELSQYILDDDPEAIFIDQREIGHGSFGAVYYVSSLPLSLRRRVLRKFSPFVAVYTKCTRSIKLLKVFVEAPHAWCSAKGL